MTWVKRNNRPKLGISSCLLGEKVRYDGDHKRNTFIIEQLSRQFEFVPICPEVAIGMGIPRPPMHLVDCDGDIRALDIANPDKDMTQSLSDYAIEISQQLASLSGYIFKSKSPSCGITGVKVWNGRDYELRGQGIFARAVMQALPGLPLIDEQQLADEFLREQFFKNVNTHYQSLQKQLLT